MDLKEQVLQRLEAYRGSSVNGANLAEEFNVTRSAIWKAIKALQADGYSITSVRNRGYCLEDHNDILSKESLFPYLTAKGRTFDIEVFPTLPSTNTYLKSLASSGVPEGKVIFALEQTQGKGRMGRSFYSPKSTGLYFSVLLRPTLSLEDSLLITSSAAVAVARAIEAIFPVTAQIKWVNDIFVADKKVCGILTEASLNFESGQLDYAVLGIGINVSTEHFPEHIQAIAGSLADGIQTTTPIHIRLAAECLNQLGDMINRYSDSSYITEYKQRSFIIGRTIQIIKGDNTQSAIAVSLDDRAHLTVQYEDGTMEVLQSGEVSIRPQA